MNLRSPSFWIGFLSASFVLWIALKDIGRTSPGELATVHERIPELASSSGCAECHGGFGTSLGEACKECHEPIGEQVANGSGLHGLLEDTVSNECALCHSDHHGDNFAMVNERSFFIAGVKDPEQFDHELIGFAMEGKHLELDCTECHEFALEPILPEGEPRFIGLAQDCATCHEDPHGGEMARSCAECHGQVAFDQLDTFVHDDRFPLVGSHATPACIDCHAEDGLHSVDALGSSQSRPRWRECIDCHDSPHASQFIEGVAQLASMTLGASCESCHDVAHESFRRVPDGITDEQHAESGFTLAFPHEEVGCEGCHTEEVSDFAVRYPGRIAAECRHCHDDAHRGFFDQIMVETAGVELGECAHCHFATTFTEAPGDDFDHDFWTGFAVLGAHAQNDCESCHARAGDADEFGRTFGWIPDHFGKVEGCGNCHIDPHDGSFARADLPALIEGRAGCARCHVETSFRTFADEFDHELWAEFPLDRAHGEASCVECHVPILGSRGDGRSFERARGRECADCHTDPHAGQFREDDRTDCSRCHTSTRRFSTLSFLHNRDSRFPLEGAHRDVQCAECHQPWALQNGTQVVRYKPLPTDCIDCHGVGESELRKRGKGQRR